MLVYWRVDQQNTCPQLPNRFHGSPGHRAVNLNTGQAGRWSVPCGSPLPFCWVAATCCLDFVGVTLNKTVGVHPLGFLPTKTFTVSSGLCVFFMSWYGESPIGGGWMIPGWLEIPLVSMLDRWRWRFGMASTGAPIIPAIGSDVIWLGGRFMHILIGRRIPFPNTSNCKNARKSLKKKQTVFFWSFWCVATAFLVVSVE